MTNQTQGKESPDTMSGSGSVEGYRVEARYMGHEPKPFAGLILDKEWRLLTFNDKTPIGVPIGDSYHAPMLKQTYCFSYQCAQALRWWFHAQAEVEMLGGLCLETRIVKYEIQYSHSAKRVSEHCLIGGDDRSNCMPDWGKKS